MSHRDDIPEERPMSGFDSSDFRATWDEHGHATEETIFARLDGALSTDDAEALDLHSNGCPICAASVAEARGYIAASARILTAADLAPRNLVPQVDVTRTAARIVALADSRDATGPRREDSAETRTQPASNSRSRRFTNNTPLRIAAGLLVMVGGTFVVQHTMERTRTTEFVAETPVPVAVTKEKAKADSTTASAIAAVERPKPAGSATVAAAPAKKMQAIPPVGQSPRADALDKDASKSLPGVNVQGIQTAERNSVNVSVAAVAAVVAESAVVPRTLSGVVIDAETSKPIAAAQVLIVGTTISALTDEEGKFTMKGGPESVSQLQVRRIGYAIADIGLDTLANSNRPLSVSLRAATLQLSAVVTTTAGSAKADLPCIVIDAAPSGTTKPIVRQISLRPTGSGAYEAILAGWPGDGDETETTLTPNAQKILRGTATVGDVRIDVELVPRGAQWFSTLREYRGANIRAVNVRYIKSTSGGSCQ